MLQNSSANPQQTKRRRPANVAQAVQIMESKHPVSLLGEISAKRKWQSPKYDLMSEAGPHHNRQFLFRVIFFFIIGVGKLNINFPTGGNERYVVSTSNC